MPYIGNTIRAADDYRLIDDISSGFNGSETSFALQVAGSAPVPFPKSPQQVLISVNGVIQEPDPTGSSGFNLVGTNIVFSSAPTNGHAFFGIIYATADYLNAGGNFPAGSLGAPSITFIGDENTGLFRKSGGSVGFVSDATEIANFDSNGITISSGNLILGDSAGTSSDRVVLGASSDLSIYHDGSHSRIDETGTGNLMIQSNNAVFIKKGTAENIAVFNADGAVELYHDNVKKLETKAQGIIISNQGNNRILDIHHTDGTSAYISFQDSNTTDNASVRLGAEGDEMKIFAGNSERVRIDSSGKLGINETNPSEMLHIKAEDNTDSFGGLIIKANNNSVHMKYGWRGLDANSGGDIRFAVGGTEMMRVLSSGKVGLGRSSADEMLHIKADDNNDGFGGLKIDANNGSIQCKYGWLGADGSNSFRIAVAGTERMRVANDGNVGIGTTSPAANLHLKDGSANTEIKLQGGASTANDVIAFLNSAGSTRGNITYDTDNNFLMFNVNTSERLRIDSSGQVGIGTASPVGRLHVHNSGTGSGDHAYAFFTTGDTGATANDGLTVGVAATQVATINYREAGALSIGTSSTERMRITSDGKVGIGLTNPDQLLHVYQSSGSSQAYVHVQNNRSRNAAIKFTTTQGSWLVGQGIGNDNDRFAIYDNAERFVLNSSGNVGIGTASPTHRLHVSGTTRATQLFINTASGHNSSRVHIVGHSTGSHTNIRCANSAGTELFKVRNDNSTFVGALSKSSGSFFIPHPLPSLAATKTLRHSFIEGPQCDNIYRGKVTLSSGTASINLDTVSKMTEGTFVVLNRDVQCFTSNETSYTGVKGSVSGNILTITSEDNSSTDTISWMVVGERQDPTIKESTITDDDGYLLVEEDKEDEVV